jgi:hypothetical protein
MTRSGSANPGKKFTQALALVPGIFNYLLALIYSLFKKIYKRKKIKEYFMIVYLI